MRREIKRLVFVWMPGHRELVRNEWADEADGEARRLNYNGGTEFG